MVGTLLLAMALLIPMDQTVNVSKGTKLDINNFAGDVTIKVWDRDAVRVEVNHSDREIVDVKQGEQVVTIRSRAVRGGRPRSLDFTLTVPKWMAVTVSGTYADVTMDGVGADVTVDTNQGDINVTGGSGLITLKSIQGEVTLQKAKGRIDVRAVNEGMRLADISGDLSAETTNGSIILDRIDSGNVDLYTVNGNISYDGPIKEKGLYRLTTHNGLIAMAVPDKSNATLSVRTYNGSFRSTFPIPPDPSGEARRKRFTLNLGNGSARVELESFQGTIALRRPGEPRPETERKRQRDHQPHDADIDAAVEQALAALPAAIAEAEAAIPHAIEEAMASIPMAIEAALAATERAFVVPKPRPMPMPTPRPLPRKR